MYVIGRTPEQIHVCYGHFVRRSAEYTGKPASTIYSSFLSCSFLSLVSTYISSFLSCSIAHFGIYLGCMLNVFHYV